MSVHTFVVEQGVADRADRVVAQALDISRGAARRLFDDDLVSVEGVAISPSAKMSEGITVVVEMPETVPVIEPDVSVDFAVAYEDSDLLVVDKPIGVIVHPAGDLSKPSLVHGLLARYPEIHGVGQTDRWGIVHRLDRDTSGLLIVAKTDRAYQELVTMMRERLVSRRYLALVAGTFGNTRGTIEAPIGRDPANPTRMMIQRGGRDARTHYRRLASWDTADASLTSVSLDTGRTHQIRVHMRSIDHPIIGDGAYGKRGTKGDPGRPWLHARQLKLVHPISGQDLDVSSPLPQDLTDSLDVLGTPDAGSLTDSNGASI